MLKEKLTIKEQLEITRYKMNLRRAYKKASNLELQIALNELTLEINRRK